MREKLTYGICLILGIVGVYLLGMSVMKFLDEKTNLNTELTNLHNEQKNLKTELSKLKEIQQQYEDYEVKLKNVSSQLSELEKLLPQELEIGAIIRELVSITKKYQLQIEKITPSSKPADHPFFKSQTLEYQVSGPYEGFQKFLDQLSLNNKFFRVLNMNVSGKTEFMSDQIVASFKTEYYIRNSEKNDKN